LFPSQVTAWIVLILRLHGRHIIGRVGCHGMSGHERHGKRQLMEWDKIPRSISVWAPPIEIGVTIVRLARLEIIAIRMKVVVTASAIIVIIARTGIRIIAIRSVT